MTYYVLRLDGEWLGDYRHIGHALERLAQAMERGGRVATIEKVSE